jgi:lipopolysaccharide transport system permease protein
MSTVNCQLPTANSSTAELPVVVYSPESPLAHPGKLVKEICADLWRCRELTWILFTRDLKAQYRQSYFGYIWLFVPVISTTIVWMFLSSTQVIQVAATPIPYPAYVMLGTMIWGVFTASVNQPLASFQAGQSVFMKLKVPPEAFILAGMSKIFFELLIRIVVLVPVFIALKIVPASTFWLFPVGLAAASLTGAAIGMALIPLGSLYSDVSRLVSTAMAFGMYITPIVYPPPKSGWASKVIEWNPITSIVMVSRDWLTIGHSEYMLPFVCTVLFATILLSLSIVVFRVVLPHLIERMGM